MQSPKSLSRELLLRGITCKIQGRAFGGLAGSILRKLAASEAKAPSAECRKPPPRTVFRPGTCLVREVNGDTYVLVHSDGAERRGTRNTSLSIIAREITGAHWAGPQFFGLTAG